MTITSTDTAALTVAQFSARIGRALRSVGGGLVEGEVQTPKVTPGGMLVFDLTDGTAKLACKVFRGQVAGLEHRPRHGDLVQARIDRPDLWAQGGKLDVIVSEVRLAGEGELLRRRDELLRQLTDEGLCDSDRRPLLPRFPRAVGVIAGKESDGMRDVVAALQDRFRPVHIITCAAVVQGARAPLNVIDALAHLDAHPLVDVIVIARGGGSVQDLVAFDDERLCRAVSVCGTPVIAAIGHTDNVPVCNHVAWAKETPSRSPELAVPSAETLRQDLRLAAAELAPVPSRMRALSDAVASVRVDAGSALDARKLDVAGAAGMLHGAEHAFFAERETGVADAREALAAAPGRIPDTADIYALAGRLDTRAVTFFAARTETVRKAADFVASVREALGAHVEAVRETGRALRNVRPALDAHTRAVADAAPVSGLAAAALDARQRATDEEGERLAFGIRKELADHLRDYGRALTRHTDALAHAGLQRLATQQQCTTDTGERLDENSRRRLADAERALGHVTALLDASDPRRRGWVLPTDEAGAVVRSARGVTVGDRLTLSFHDGAAGAVIDHIPDQEEP